MVYIVLFILIWKCILRYNGRHFFDVLIFKSGLERYFIDFDLEMRFAPQWYVIFYLLFG